jgi:radical SAM protein with 4Fe4S-binding SPASM domain
MYIKSKSNVIFRRHDSFGFITDNRNFGYKKTNSDENHIGDKILSESGAVFFSVLGKKPKHIDNIAKEICRFFTGVDLDIIKKDAIDFYSTLERDGFVTSGITVQECDAKDAKFSYKEVEPKEFNKDFSQNIEPIEKSTQEFLEEYFKGEPQLTNLHIEITSKCNERCLHCYIPHEEKVSSIDSDLFYGILNQCRNMNVVHLTISGGEPMLHKEFCNFLNKCNEYNFSVNILSNLTLLDDQTLEEMKSNPLLGVQVSLYSMNPDVHDDITQSKGSFNKTKTAILRLIDNDIPLQISCPIMKQNKNCYDDVIKWADKNKINVSDDYVLIARYNHTTTNLNCRLSIAEVKDVIKNRAAKSDRFLEEMELESKKKQSISLDDYVCSVCHSSVCIADNGNVYPCAGWQDYVVGNVKETSLSEIWINSPKVRYLRGLRNSDFPKCKECADKEFCTMCMVRNANESPIGDPLDVNDYFCNIAKLNKDIMLKWREGVIDS